MTARALIKSATAQRSSPSLTSPGASMPQLPNQSVQADGMRDRLPSGSTTNNNGTPRRVSPLITARRHPWKGWRLRVITTEVGTSWEWVVCGVFVRQHPACGAPQKGGPARRRRQVLRLIKMWLRSPVEERDGDGKRRMSGGKGNRRGTPQGGVVSPLLANIYMNRFLKHWRLSGCGKPFARRSSLTPTISSSSAAAARPRRWPGQGR